MPANLPPQYYELEREFKAERDLHRKLELAQELLAIMPKHKGTDKLQAEMKAKISKLNSQLQSSKKHGDAHHEDFTHIEREGAGQVIIIGPPNSGKSSIVGLLTHAHTEMAPFPFSTRKPVAGMMPFENIQIQLIDTPPIAPELTEKYIPELVRKADMVVITVDATSPGNLEEMEYLFDFFRQRSFEFSKNPSTKNEIENKWQKRGIMAVTHIDQPGGDGAVEVLREFYGNRLSIFGLSVTANLNVNEFKRALFESLEIIRVYCKQPGKEPDLQYPVLLPVGSNAAAMALEIHKDLAHNLKFAKIWGKGVFDGQMVSGEHPLHDGDIVELHI